MELTKEQSFKIKYNSAKETGFNEKYKFTTKYKWYCLHCLKPLYISFHEYSINQIFCEDCTNSKMEKTIVQYQYMRVLKERQTILINSLIKSKNNNNINNI